MALTVTDEAIDRVLERLIREHLPEGELQRLLDAKLEDMLGAIPLEQAARLQGWEPIPFRRLLRKHGIQLVYLSHKKASVAVADLKRLVADHKIPISVRKRKPKAK